MRRRHYLVFAVLLICMLIAPVALAQTATPVPPTAVPGLSLDIDVQPLFDAIGTYLPPLLAILAIGGGIKIAIKLGGFLIDSISSAFGA